jgi:predicted phosphodiesterase
MRMVIYSDVHGDIFALKKLYQKEHADIYICLGDVVGYLPLGYECVNFIKEQRNTHCIIGNHEKMLLNSKIEAGCSNNAQIFFWENMRFYDMYDKDFIKNLPASLTMGERVFSHTLNGQYIYPSTIIESLEHDTFIGHSHRSFIKKIGDNTLINVGSLGQNREDLSICNYLVFDEELLTFQFKGFYRDIESLIGVLKDFKFPKECIQYYSKRLNSK